MRAFRSVRMFLTISGSRRDLRPNLTPRSLALAMPSICRSRRVSFSNSAISARMPMTSLPVQELVLAAGMSGEAQLADLVLP